MKKKMNKVISFLIIFGIILYNFNVLPYVYADTNVMEYEDFKYTLSGDEIEIVSYTGSDSDVVIPSQIDGKDVAIIGADAFSKNTDIENVTFPNTLRTIKRSAFYNCKNLTSINVPKSLTSCYDQFGNLADSTSGTVFLGCEKLDNITFEEGITEIPAHIFVGCTGLKDITIPDTVTAIGDKAFTGTALTEVIIPDSVVKIGLGSFSNCKSLSEIKLSKSLEMIDRNAFFGCESLTSIEIPKSLKRCNEQFDNLPAETSGAIFTGCNNLKNVTFEEGITAIPGHLLVGCAGVTEITIPDTVTEIGAKAFTGTSLTEVIMPDSVVKIGLGSFSNCKSLSEVKLSKSLELIDRNAFYGCESLTSIEIPKSLKRCNEQFDNLPSETAGAIFANCNKLTDISFEEGITEIPGHLFVGCSSIRDVTIPDTVKIIGDKAFAGTGLQTVVIPDGVTDLNFACFANCEYLNCVVLSESLNTIGKSAFKACSELDHINLSDNISYIANDSFSGCDNIQISTNYWSDTVVYCIDNDFDFLPSASLTTKDIPLVDRQESSYTYDIKTSTANNAILMSIDYKCDASVSGRLEDEKIVVFIPKSTEIIEDSIKLNEKCINDYVYDEKSRRLIIPFENDECKISFSATITSNDKIKSYAYISGRVDGVDSQETIGAINDNNDGISLNCPDAVNKSSIDISGVAGSSKDVSVYLDGVEQTTVTSKKNGSYSCTVNLSDPIEYKAYDITVASTDGNGNEIKATQIVYYNSSIPSVNSLVLQFKDHSNKEREVVLSDNSDVKPVVYYDPSKEYTFVADIENSENIETVYITSTRNNVKKRIEAVPDGNTGRYVATGFFDETNKSYVPGDIGVEFVQKRVEIEASEDFDFSALLDANSEFIDSAEVNYEVNTENEVEASIDWQKLYKDYGSGTVKAKLKTIDAKSGTSISDYYDLFDFYETVQKYTVKGKDGKSYTLELDLSDKRELAMLIYDTVDVGFFKTGDKIYSFELNTMDFCDENYAKVFSHAQTFAEASRAAGFLYKSYCIYDDYNSLVDEIDQSPTITDKAGAKKAAGELRDDQMYFLVMMTALPLLVAGSSMVMPALVFSCMLAMISSCSNVFWDNRVAQIKGEKYKANWIVDPSGYIYDNKTGDRLEGATVSAYYIPYDGTDDFYNNAPDPEEIGQLWDASEYEQSNPLISDEDGKYAWDVPEGWWRVKCELEGYQDAWTDWMTVPPIQTDVNIPMVLEGEEPHVHEEEIIPAVEASCTTDGLSEGKKCATCGEILVEQEVVKPALGHDWEEKKVIKKATCKEEGRILYKCRRCGEEMESPVKKKAHTIVVDKGVEPTTKSTGLTVGTHCSVCGEVIVRQEVIPKLKDNDDYKPEVVPKDIDSQSGNDKNDKNKKSTSKPSNEWIDGKWYDANGNQTYSGTLLWKRNATGWWVEDTDGWYPINQWQKINGVWYYFNSAGYMANNEYYNGCWFNNDGSWDDKYFLTWKCDSKGWWVEDKSGWWPSSAWLKIDGYWYYFDSSGYMVTNQYIDGWWIGADGVCY